MTIETNFINNEYPVIVGTSTQNAIINIYNQNFSLEKSIEIITGKFIITLDDVMENNIAFTITKTTNNIESGFLKILPINLNYEKYNTTC